MNHIAFTFSTQAFVDPADVLEQNVNGIAGCALANWLSTQIRTEGPGVDACWPEDHGWDFSVVRDDATYLVSCSLEDREAHVVLYRPRSLLDKLFGRNLLEADDQVATMIRKALAVSPEVRDLVEHTSAQKKVA